MRTLADVQREQLALLRLMALYQRAAARSGDRPNAAAIGAQVALGEEMCRVAGIGEAEIAAAVWGEPAREGA